MRSPITRAFLLVTLIFILLTLFVGFRNSAEADSHLVSYLPLAQHFGPAAPSTPTSTPEVNPTSTPVSGPTPTRPPVQGDAIVVDHTSIDDFDRIPDAYVQAAEVLDMIFVDRSVGMNISDGLTCLSYPSHDAAPNNCVRYEHVDPSFSVSPSVVSWNRPGGYDRSRWDYAPWPDNCSEWYTKIECYMNLVRPQINNYDVLSFQYSYLEVGEGSTIADLPGGFFSNNGSHLDVYDLAAFEAQYPNKVFIYWTSSLSRGIGSSVSQSFNDQMRNYAISNEKVLFDVADILSHDPNGNPCYDNRDGVPYSNGNNSENHPDDGQNLLAICQHYTTETDGGHLGSVSAGKIRVAKAFWVLMARIAGWDGS